jgi:hypothetical protein
MREKDGSLRQLRNLSNNPDILPKRRKIMEQGFKYLGDGGKYHFPNLPVPRT